MLHGSQFHQLLGKFHRAFSPFSKRIQVNSTTPKHLLLNGPFLKYSTKEFKVPEATKKSGENLESSSKNMVLMRIWRRYLRLTDAHPLKTQAMTALIFAGLGNFIAQTMVEKRSLYNLDWPSICKFTAISVCISFPIIRSWLWVLETVVKPGKLAPLKRMLMDQLLFAPTFLACFIVLMGFVEGTGWEDAKRRLSNDWVNVMISNYKLWPAVQLLNFYLIPFNQRILFGSLVSLLWNTYLAFVVRQGTGGNSAEK